MTMMMHSASMKPAHPHKRADRAGGDHPDKCARDEGEPPQQQDRDQADEQRVALTHAPKTSSSSTRIGIHCSSAASRAARGAAAFEEATSDSKASK